MKTILIVFATIAVLSAVLVIWAYLLERLNDTGEEDRLEAERIKNQRAQKDRPTGGA